MAVAWVRWLLLFAKGVYLSLPEELLSFYFYKSVQLGSAQLACAPSAAKLGNASSI